ncbi:adenylate/guanylate cyclase domain-containing protein [Crenobacter sp. SG2303]|uniref:Adenylate/guanylate cyclase domain-containing protein n=1 Tax=Crenobacter oryzisoli TaxID=3056844 RepID=A0ABT7XR97_9NEIS|nr:adenylate/guanylate cyclase domain-containing protein [Crenobacter sp. SG2303]MDN0076322.1 adenylate/guanylate cyclase domain-containing protein [Crenobacter sp. SG2303]MDN0076811.1 adenylate/guanylate cyclase domain-containing protein [Crenobacter sp. SG2303]
MRCASCGFENPTGAKFCEECGAKVVRACPACGHEASASAKFCSECGAPLNGPPPSAALATTAPIDYTPPYLAERIRAAQAAMEARGVADGERKTVTALFADMAGSTALIHDLDPEDARRLIDPVLALMMEAVHHYEGYVAKSMGDGILALFGAPIANEDHPQRALLAALRMQEAMHRYADGVRLAQGIALQIRVGINSGEVVVRTIRIHDLHTDYDPVGNSIHIASRMEGIAVPGSIVASEHTRHLTEGYFAFKALGATPIKGLPEPLAVFEVLGLGPLRTRLQVSASRGLARFVGRSRELGQLRAARAGAQAGHGQIVGMVGDPGVGKSRLYHEFKLLAPRDCLVLETFSVSHGKAYPYLPLIELLRNYCQLTAQDDERRRRERITGKVLTLDRALEDTLPYLFHLLGAAEPNSALAMMDPQIRRQRTFEAIKRLLVRESLTQPLELIVEDLQWLDSETEAFLGFLGESVGNARILLLVNYRPEYRHDWGRKSYYTQLRLDPLGEAEARELLHALLGDAPGLAPLERLILELTEGNPFFIEEVVQALAEGHVLQGERGHYRLEQLPGRLQIPATVQGVLASRIDRLQPAEKALLQTLAVIGKVFTWSLLARVVDQSEDTMKSLLTRLQAGEFIYEQPAFPEVEYSFKHALTQEVAYGSLLSDQRRALHERTGQAIEALFGARLEEHSSELAHHFSRSGNAPKAVEYLHCAGRQALQRSADAEAVAHLTTALALLATLPDAPERTRQELELLITLGPAWMATKGHAAPEVEATYTRALTLCRQLGETIQLFPALLGLRTFYLVRGELLTSRELGEQLLTLARKAQDPALLAQAHRALGTSLLGLGELDPARAQLEQALALYDPSAAFFYGLEPGVLGLAYFALDLWLLGYPDQALARSQEMLALAQIRSQPPDSANALIFAAELHLHRREAQPTRELTEAAIALATEHGFPYFLAYGTILSGWVLAEQGCAAEGVERMQQGLAAYRATGAEHWQTHYLALLAEAYGRAGQTEAGLETLTEALAVVDQKQERVYEAELYRLKGELMLQQPSREGEEAGGWDEAEACFLKAIAIARRQGARSLELRAVMGLSRLWRQQGKPGDARRILAETYDWFTEGFDTADLQEAGALLAALS